MARIMMAVSMILLLLFCNKFIVGENADKDEFKQGYTIDEMIDNYSQASKPSTGGACHGGACHGGACHGDRDGRDGHPGHPGRDGRDGCPGVVGPKGQAGVNGLPGTDGINGINGKPGKNGSQGLPGKNGTDGKPGKNGKNGINGKYGTARNIKQCAWKTLNGTTTHNYDETNDGLIKDCSIQKRVASSELLVTISTTICVYGTCKRWFVTFDGNECAPVPIDHALYRNEDNRDFIPLTLNGLCKVNKSGLVRVGLNNADCANKNVNDHGDTGYYRSTFRILIEEVEPQS